MSWNKEFWLKCPFCDSTSFRVNPISKIVVYDESTIIQKTTHTEVVCARCDSLVKTIPSNDSYVLLSNSEQK